MPAFGYDEGQIADLRAFLTEIDRPDVGRGQLRLGDPEAGTTPQAAFESAVLDANPPADVAAGFESFRSGVCAACHFPFQRSVVGAPDLSTVVERVDDAGLRTVLTDGRPALGMPPPAPVLSGLQQESLIAYFHWLNENREAITSASAARQSRRDVDWSRLSWWEYR